MSTMESAERAAASPTVATIPATDLVDIRDLVVDYRARGRQRGNVQSNVVRAVDGVSFSIARGETLGLVGGTGSGKSTIAQVVMGMVEPTSGDVWVAGKLTKDLKGRALLEHRQQVQVVMQDPYSSLDPRMRVEDIIAEPLTLGRPIVRGRSGIKARVAELLGLVGLSPAKAALYPHQFSGGQRQRIAIARALAPRPQVIVLDEPTSALDVSVRAQILNLLKSLQQRLGVTYLVISHDLVSVAYLASRVAVMYQGRIVEIGPTSEMYRAARHPYTLLLHESAPNTDGSFLRILQPAVLPIRQEGVHRSEDGCRYASRCGLRVRLGEPARCTLEEPSLAPATRGEHFAACHYADKTFDLSRQAMEAESSIIPGSLEGASNS